MTEHEHVGMYSWVCAHCRDTYCDDCQSPALILEGKPYLEITEGNFIPTEYFLCKSCKNKYFERNACKGRYNRKIYGYKPRRTRRDNTK